MTNLRTDVIALFRSLTKFGTDKNKAIYSITDCAMDMTNYVYIKVILMVPSEGSLYMCFTVCYMYWQDLVIFFHFFGQSFWYG